MFALQLNDMRAANVENEQFVAVAETAEALIDYMKKHTAPEPYRDGQWHRTYTGPLMWYNPPWAGDGIFNIGTAEEWAANAVIRFNRLVGQLPMIYPGGSDLSPEAQRYFAPHEVSMVKEVTPGVEPRKTDE